MSSFDSCLALCRMGESLEETQKRFAQHILIYLHSIILECFLSTAAFLHLPFFHFPFDYGWGLFLAEVLFKTGKIEKYTVMTYGPKIICSIKTSFNYDHSMFW